MDDQVLRAVVSRGALTPALSAAEDQLEPTAAWNGFGALPRRVGDKGSVRRLVPIANELGFYWGGHFSRRDGMHFELARL